MKQFFSIVALFIGSAFVNAAQAAFPHGLWQVDQYDFESKEQVNRMETCIFSDGTISQGKLDSTILWDGQWRMSGNVVLLRMNQLIGSGVATYALSAITDNLMTGYNLSFDYDDVTTNGYYIRSVWSFKGDVCE